METCSPRGHIGGDKNPVDAGLELGQGCKAFFLCHRRERFVSKWGEPGDHAETRGKVVPKPKGTAGLHGEL